MERGGKREVNLMTSRTVVRCPEQEAIVSWMVDAWGYPGPDMWDGAHDRLFEMLIDALYVLSAAEVSAEFGSQAVDDFRGRVRFASGKPDDQWDELDHVVYGVIETVSAGVTRATRDWLRL